MAISSVSKVYTAPDPVMETDLELFGKIGSYTQSKFDTGAAAYQQEIDKWSQLTQIAKPELRTYANAKLVNLVNGINNLGGVNLSDINNVNALKSMGYNLYGDKAIMDGLITTMNMKSLQADYTKKKSGKDASKYDETVFNYQMDGYREWANDKDINNTRYDGATSVPMGTLDEINDKIIKHFKTLTPDSESYPDLGGEKEKGSFGYIQIDGKFFKKERVQEVLNTLLTENDKLVFRAHGWSALRGESDDALKQKLGILYDESASKIKQNINELTSKKLRASNAGTQMEFDAEIKKQKDALTLNNQEKQTIISKSSFSKNEREGIYESLYRNAWQSSMVNSLAYTQQKSELKTNMPNVFTSRLNQQAYQWSMDYNLRLRELEMKEKEQNGDFGVPGQQGVPTAAMPLNDPNNDGVNQQRSPAHMIDAFSSEYYKNSKAYYAELNNIIGSKNPNMFRKLPDGTWIPKEGKDGWGSGALIFDLNKALEKYPTMTDSERKKFLKENPIDESKLQELIAFRNNLTTLNTMNKIGYDAETDIIKTGMAKGKLNYDWRTLPVRVDVGSGVKDMYLSEFLATYGDNADLKVHAVPGYKYPKGFNINFTYGQGANNEKIITVKELKESVEKYRSSASKIYGEVGSKVFNSRYSVLPFDNIPDNIKEVITKQIASSPNSKNVKINIDKGVNLVRGWVQYNYDMNKPEYKVEVQATPEGGKKPVTIVSDVTSFIGGKNIGIQKYFSTERADHIWGIALAKDGSTPFDKTNNYAYSLRTATGNYPFQIIETVSALDGGITHKVKIALPVGDGKVQEVDVYNGYNHSYNFEGGIQFIQQYFTNVLQTPAEKAEFYKLHGLTMPK